MQLSILIKFHARTSSISYRSCCQKPSGKAVKPTEGICPAQQTFPPIGLLSGIVSNSICHGVSLMKISARMAGQERRTALLFILFVGGFFTASTIVLSDLAASEKGSVKRGAQVYMDNCTPCHGIDGDGQGPLGKRWAPARSLAEICPRQGEAGSPAKGTRKPLGPREISPKVKRGRNLSIYRLWF